MPPNKKDDPAEPVETPQRGIREPWFWKYLGAFTGTASAILFMGLAYKALPEGVSPIFLLIILTPFVIGFQFLYGIIANARVSRNAHSLAEQLRNAPIHQAIGYIFLFQLLAVVAMLTTLLVPSLFWGWPLDLRQYIAPQLVITKEYTFPKTLEPIFGNEALQPFNAPPNASPHEETQESMDVWKGWISQVSDYSDSEKIVVLSLPPAHEYYAKFNAKLTFPNSNGLFRLADGIAYLKKVDKGSNDPVFRQLRWHIEDANMDTANPALMQENELCNVRIDAGDSWLIIAHFAAAGTASMPADVQAYTANLVATDSNVPNDSERLQ